MGRRNVQEVRPAACAGKFYPADAEFLSKVLDGYLQGPAEKQRRKFPKAVLAPHSGYIYSGAIAGKAFRSWKGAKEIERVVLIGPSHFYDFPGIAVPDVSVFKNPRIAWHPQAWSAVIDE